METPEAVPPVRFPAFRTFDAGRIDGNDAMMALLIGTALAEVALPRGDEIRRRLLPDIFPDVPEIRRLNRSVDDARELLRNAERYLAYMAVPFVMSVYQSYLVEVISLLRRAGNDTRTVDPTMIKLRDIHGYLLDVASIELPSPESELFDFLRRLRNRIVHAGAIQGSSLRSAYSNLPRPSKELYQRLAGRHFQAAGASELLTLGAPDLRPVLAVTRHLADAISRALAAVIDVTFWARIVIEDFKELSPHRFREKPQRVRRLVGFARTYYQGVGLTAPDFERALEELGLQP